MADIALVGNDHAVTFMVSAGLVYEIIAAACSSPQTTELNAHARSATLMKWVYIGLAQAAFFVIIASLMDRDHWPALFGGGLAGVLMGVQYSHAKKAGLRSEAPATERY